nr:cbs domain-containing protein cbscbspb3 [Quercus suber]
MSTSDSEGPAWNKFWMSMDAETESMMSGEGGSHAPLTPDHRSSMMSPDNGHRPNMADRLDSVLPTDSASHNGMPDIDEHSVLGGAVEDMPFPFKFKAPNGRVHRLQVVASQGLAHFISVVAEKLGSEADGIGGIPAFEGEKLGHTGFALSYMDNEGDTVSITTDHDLLEAISLARQGRKDKVDLFVHHPDKPAMAATVDPQPILPPPPASSEGQIKSRKRYEQDEDEEDEQTSPSISQRRRERKVTAPLPKQQEQIIQGVPNEMLLPGAIGVLAVVIIVTFTIGRASSR